MFTLESTAMAVHELIALAGPWSPSLLGACHKTLSAGEGSLTSTQSVRVLSIARPAEGNLLLACQLCNVPGAASVRSHPSYRVHGAQ